MSDLGGKRRRWLRGQAHALKPLVRVGARGLTDSVVAEVDTALAAHELIKVRLAGERDERQTLAEKLADRVDAALVGVTGHVAIFFRPFDDPAERRVRPPD
jgi:RNA-binding protein